MGTRTLTITRMDEVFVVILFAGVGFAAFVEAAGVHKAVGWAHSLLTILLVAPWVEELIYRGMLLGPYLGQDVYWRRAAGAAFLFALVQGAAPILPAFVFGLFLAWVYRHFRSIAPCMLAHAAFNFAWFCHCQLNATA